MNRQFHRFGAGGDDATAEVLGRAISTPP